MENLKYAKICLGVGIALGVVIPIAVMTNQTYESARRKKNILVDHERIVKKLEANPKLKYHTNLSEMPISENEFINLLEGRKN